jgi:hypothetical protein
VKLSVDATIVTHTDHSGGVAGRKHRVFSGQLFDDFIDGGLDPE